MNDIRMPLSDKCIAQLPTPKAGWYLTRGTELKGFFVVVGERKRTFTVQGERYRFSKPIVRVGRIQLKFTAARL